MDETHQFDECHIKSWETYKVLNKMKENVQQKKKMAREKVAEQSLDANQMSIENRLSTTDCQLSGLLADGQELITNVRLANDRREVQRRSDEEQQRSQLLADLRNESEEAINKFNAINTRWSELDEGKDPMQLFDGLESQSERIKQLMTQKDEIIGELQEALDKANERYNMDQIKQEADIQCLIDRVDDQIDVMKTAYREHLELLHESIDSERRTFKQFHSNKWQDLYDDRSMAEQQHLDQSKLGKIEHQNEFSAVQLHHEEMTREMRIKLDRDNDLVQRKLQNVKAEISLNTVQLNYNHYVLQKRAVENVTVRNKQKYRLLKLRACVAAIKKKIDETTHSRTVETEKLTQELLSLYRNIKELENKICAFAEINDRKFHHVWNMHEENANNKLENILAIDKVLHEKHLGLEWQRPTHQLTRKNNKKLIRYAVVLSPSKSCDDSINALILAKLTTENLSQDQQLISNIFHSIIEQIVNQASWLLDEKLEQILESENDDQKRKIIIVDNVFVALGINCMENLHLLKKYFLSKATCIRCSVKYVENQNQPDLSQNSKTISAKVLSNVQNINMESNKLECDKGQHRFSVEPHAIPIILQQFLADINAKKHEVTTDKSLEPVPELLTDSRVLEPKGIELFWSDYENIISNDTELVWNTIENGLCQYLQVLRKRQNLNVECESLRRQNAELSHLLQKYSFA